ncbi:MAG: hypothetical protein WD875_14025 [Pirellulales bacterium]
MKTHHVTLGSLFLSRAVVATALLTPSVAGYAIAAEPAKQDAASAAATQEPKASLSWQDVEAAAAQHFKTLADYEDGDILSQGQVKPLLDQLAKAGWKVSDRAELLGQVSADNDFVVGQLRTKSGRKFMRKLGGSAEQYDRLRRLAETKGGERTVADILKLPNGNDVLAALVESKAGKDIGRQLAKGPRTQNFNKPTGYLYTQTQVMERLEESYRRDAGSEQ